LDTEQIALELQGFSWTQGLIQLLDRQARLNEHSSSAEQPSITGSPKKIIFTITLLYH